MAVAIIITRPSRSNPDRVEYLASVWIDLWTDDILNAREFPYINEEQAKGIVMEQTGDHGAGCDFVRVVPKDEMVY